MGFFFFSFSAGSLFSFVDSLSLTGSLLWDDDDFTDEESVFDVFPLISLLFALSFLGRCFAADLSLPRLVSSFCFESLPLCFEDDKGSFNDLCFEDDSESFDLCFDDERSSLLDLCLEDDNSSFDFDLDDFCLLDFSLCDGLSSESSENFTSFGDSSFAGTGFSFPASLGCPVSIIVFNIAVSDSFSVLLLLAGSSACSFSGEGSSAIVASLMSSCELSADAVASGGFVGVMSSESFSDDAVDRVSVASCVLLLGSPMARNTKPVWYPTLFPSFK
mmetsp:Transcript_25627/g.70712  ORF Transcript_25627/g.70712 Transcript_25627/m.70712 type:complete len:275 (-) Transcript_25627:199-1023(-)